MTTARSIQWLEANDLYLSKAASALRTNNSSSGIFSGLTVELIEGTNSLRVQPGSAVIQGTYFELTSIYDGIKTEAPENGIEFFVIMQRILNTNSVDNQYGEAVQRDTYYSYELGTLLVDDYVLLSQDQRAEMLVLAYGRYRTTAKLSGTGNNIVLPDNIIGIYASLDDAPHLHDPYVPATDLNADDVGDSVVVYTAPIQDVVEERIDIYEWRRIPDPVTITVVHPETHLETQAQGLWGGLSVYTDRLGNTWTQPNWTGNATVGFTHTVGFVDALSEAATYTSGKDYKVSWEITNRTAGHVNITVGGLLATGVTASGDMESEFSGAPSSLVVFPSVDFDGTIKLDVQEISISNTTAPVLHYFLPAVDVVNYPAGHHLTQAHVGYAWRQASLDDYGLSQEYFRSLVTVTVDVDVTNGRYDFIRPSFSSIDTQHRSLVSEFSDTRNIHGIGFSDVGSTKMPLHKQIFDSGFGVAPMEIHGIMGTLVDEYVNSINVQVDFFGTVTGVFGNHYLALKHVPVGVSYVVESADGVTKGNSVAYELQQDIIVLGVDFVGGSFSNYPRFYRTGEYITGDRVVRADLSGPTIGVDRLYAATKPWINTNNPALPADGFDASYFVELTRKDLLVGYYYISDLEYFRTSDNYIYTQQNNNVPIVTEGLIVPPVQTQTPKQFSLSAYKDISIPKMTLSCDSQGNLVSTETVLDRTALSSRASNQQGFVGNFGSTAQLKAYLIQTPFTKELAPPEGRLGIVTSYINDLVLVSWPPDTDVPSNILLVDTDTLVPDAYVGCFVYMLTGTDQNIGLHRTIISNTDSTITLSADLPAVPSAGDTFKIDVVAYGSQISSPLLYGRYRMFYTYHVDHRSLMVTTSQVTGLSAEYNLSSAQLIEGVNYVPRDLWVYDEASSQIIISSDAYRDGYTYTLERNASETQRNRRGYIEVVGTGAKPVGPKATAVIKLNEYDRFEIGDYVTITIPNTANPITKTLRPAAGYTGFASGPVGDVPAMAQNIVTAFQNDPVFIESGSTATVDTTSGVSIIFTAGVGGTDGNSYNVAVSSVNTSMQIKQQFQGGGDHVFSFDDLLNLSYSIEDLRSVDQDGQFSVWSTGDLNSEYPETLYHRLGTVYDDYSGLVTSKVTTLYTIDETTDITNELSVTVQLTGSDTEGNILTENLVFDNASFCDIQNYRVTNPYAYVRSVNMYSSLTGWACLDKQNFGSSVLVIVSESSSGTRDLFDVCDMSWSGSRLLWVHDRRNFVDATTNRPTSNVSAEALSNVAALLQL